MYEVSFIGLTLILGQFKQKLSRHLERKIFSETVLTEEDEKRIKHQQGEKSWLIREVYN